MSRAITTGRLTWAALLLTGCVSLSDGDRLWEAGEHRDALELYERLARSTDEEAPVLLREGLLRSVPDTEVFDPEEARRLLTAVVEGYPGSVWEVEARLVLDGLDAELERRRLEDETAGLRRRLETLEAQDARLRAALEVEGSRSGGLVERLEELHEESERLRAEVARLKTEIDELKAIDLDRPPDF
ncbi:MAG: hypothetical protein R2991_00730 [Thermoanaerobaculia bacterium]